MPRQIRLIFASMDRILDSWHSPALGKQMEIAVYGHYGPALLMFPSAGADYLEYERFQLVESIAPFLDAGRMKAFSINSINNESWLNDGMEPRMKSIRHQQYNRYIAEEVVPYIAGNQHSSHPVIYTTGVSLGALHAVNSFLRRPDLFDGTIGMSGVYDLKSYTKGYFDDDVYFNSPIDYLPNLGGPTLEALRRKHKVYLLSGKGEFEDPHASWLLGEVMGQKGITNWVELWGEEYRHDWPTWRDMLPSVLERYF
jgi:esterase/lipase superfamily enzyme